MRNRLLSVILFLSLCCARATASPWSADTTVNAGRDSVASDTVAVWFSDSLQTGMPAEQENEVFIEADTVMRESADTAFTTLTFKTEETIDSLRAVQLKFKPDPNKSVWYALAFPGLGQIYNRKYWKLPIVYGGVAGIAYAITWNSKYYNDYYNAYRDYMDANPNTNSYMDLIPENYPEGQIESYLNSRQSTYRRYRDLSIIIGVAFYAITVIDAFVDAQLAEFDISPDLSMKVKPKFMEQPNTTRPSVGCALQVNF